MKKFIVLTAVAALTAAFAGCECCRIFQRGAFFPCAQPSVMCVDPCAPACPTGACGAMSTPMITPGPETYAPAPVN